ncbi:hypothetical protein PLESTM_001509200 [Pleodorina starrii]|nr:hypothetical protein PLESTM_001509200 [Pleodorina starrii]
MHQQQQQQQQQASEGAAAEQAASGQDAPATTVGGSPKPADAFSRRLDPRNAAGLAEAVAALNADVPEDLSLVEQELAEGAALMAAGSGPEEAGDDGRRQPLHNVPLQGQLWTGDIDRADQACGHTHTQGGMHGCTSHGHGREQEQEQDRSG